MAATNKTPTRGKAKAGWQERFLIEFARLGRVTQASESAGVSRATVYRERQANEDFALAWHDVEETLIDRLEEEGMERALNGSDRLLEFFLRCRRASVYADTHKLEHSGKVGGLSELVALAREHADSD